MMESLVYLALIGCYSLVPSIVAGVIISLIDLDAGLIGGAAVFAWAFIDFVSARKKKWGR